MGSGRVWFQRILESGSWFNVGVFGTNLPLVSVKNFTYSLLHKETYKTCVISMRFANMILN